MSQAVLRLKRIGKSFNIKQAAYFLKRLWVKLRLKTARLANIGANSDVFRGFAGVVRYLAGVCAKGGWLLGRLLSKLFDLLYFPARGAYRWLVRFFRKLAQLLATLVDELRLWRNGEQKRARGRIVPVSALFVLTLLIFSGSYLGVGLELEIGGVPVGFVKSRAEIDRAVEEVEAQVGEYLGTPYNLNLDISLSLRYMDNGKLMDNNTIKTVLYENIGQISTQYVLLVDNEVVAANESKNALEMMLNRVMKSRSYIDPNAQTEFVQDVSIEERAVLNMQVKTIPEIEEMLNSDSREIQSHVVKAGETVSEIAQMYGLTISEIEQLNPGIDISVINVGDEIEVSAPVPFLSLKQTIREEYNSAIPYETVTQTSDSMYVNESKVITPGVQGSAFVVADVEYVDGIEQSRDILTYQVISEPVSEVKLVGTKPLPEKAATGTFVKPCSGPLSSPYGYRRSLGDFHTGADFSGAVGTSVWASDGGTVIFAGWKGNYGKLVIIDHGNGYTTYYAHNNEILVKKGQKVAQNEQIAKMGATGRVTGPHCHFEIRINGDTVDPLDYIY